MLMYLDVLDFDRKRLKFGLSLPTFSRSYYVTVSSDFTRARATLYMYRYTGIRRQPVFSCFCQFSNSLKLPECNTEDNTNKEKTREH